jgi:hypothetical protein
VWKVGKKTRVIPVLIILSALAASLFALRSTRPRPGVLTGVGSMRT